MFSETPRPMRPLGQSLPLRSSSPGNLVFASLNIIQFVVGSYLEPRVAGSALSISPFVVLFTVFLWSFLWGIAGAFIGVPIVIAILTVCEQYPASRWVAQVLGGTAPEAA